MLKEILIALVLIFPALATASEPTGHTWKALPELAKASYVRGFIMGYNWRDSLEREMAKLIEKRPVSQKMDFKQDMNYYMREVDAFYEAFPLCRGVGLDKTLLNLVWIWGGYSMTYEKAGKECR